MQLASYLEGSSLMWMSLLHLHVNSNTDDDDDDDDNDDDDDDSTFSSILSSLKTRSFGRNTLGTT